jgi:hypothetical protein
MLVGDRVVKVVPCRKCPDSRAYGVDTRAVKRVEIGAGGWVNTTGSVFKQVSDSTGYLDAYVAHYIKEVQVITYDPRNELQADEPRQRVSTRSAVTIVFTAATEVDNTLSTTLANIQGSSTEAITIELTTDGTGALTNGVLTLSSRPRPMNGEA